MATLATVLYLCLSCAGKERYTVAMSTAPQVVQLCWRNLFLWEGMSGYASSPKKSQPRAYTHRTHTQRQTNTQMDREVDRQTDGHAGGSGTLIHLQERTVKRW